MLLRDNEVSSFPALLRRVLEDVRRDQQGLGSSSATNGADVAKDKDSKDKDKEKDKPNGEKKAVNGTASTGGGDKQSLAMPSAVVEDALRVTMDCLKEIVSLEE